MEEKEILERLLMIRFSRNIRLVLLFLALICPLSSQNEWEYPVNLTILNSKENDFAPSWSVWENKLYFNSDSEGYSYFYSSKSIDFNNFSQPAKITDKINLNSSNRSYLSFQSNKVAYLSAYFLYSDRPYINIFKSIREKSSWSEPVKDDSLNTESYASQVTISPDGSILIFVSDRDNNNYDTDLWMAYRQENGSWGALVPINELNSIGNEITPFLKSADTLYFATNGQEGPGGYDIFISVRADGIWQRPYQLSDVNTEFNESDFTLLPNGSGIFASDRPGGSGKLDLYLVESKEKIQFIENEITNEIILETLLSSIKVTDKFSFKFYPIIPYIFYQNSSNDLWEEFLHIDPSENFPLNDLDLAYLTSIAAIIENINNNNIHSFSIVSPASMSNDLSVLINGDKSRLNFENRKVKISGLNDIKRLLLSETSIEDGKISLLFANDSVKLPYLYSKINSSDSRLLQHVSLGSHNYSIRPPILDIIVNSSYKNTGKYYLELGFSGSDTLRLAVYDSLPDRIPINLDEFKDKLWRSDSVQVILSSDSEKSRGYLSVPIIKSLEEDYIKEGSSNSQYISSFFFCCSTDDIYILEQMDSKFEYLKLYSGNSTELTLISYDSINDPFLPSISKVIEKKFGISPNNKFIKISDSQIKLSNNLMPCLYELRLNLKK